MKVLYFTDGYAYSNMGTKRSLFEEVRRRDNKMIKVNIRQIGSILSLIKEHKPDQVWLAHSNLRLNSKLKEQIHIPVIGFGFSDPYYFSPKRFIGYDIYVTNHIGTFEKYKKKIPMIYNPTACDFGFHYRNEEVEKSIDISILGLAKHPRFRNKSERIVVVDKIRKFFGKQYLIHAYGRGWPKHLNNHGGIVGEQFRSVIQHSKLGLDIQDDFSPMSHRMFEYGGCGIPVITRRRPEVFKFFEDGIEILTYSTYEELLEKVDHYLHNLGKLDKMGLRAWIRCMDCHNISHRVDHLLGELGKVVSCT